MKKLLIFCLLTGCTSLVPKRLQGFYNTSERGLASVKPAELMCKRLRIPSEKKKSCRELNNEISNFAVSFCANLDISPEQKFSCLGIVSEKGVSDTVVSFCANLQVSSEQKFSYLRDLAGKGISDLAVPLCEKLWETAQQKVDCLLEESVASASSASNGNLHQEIK